MGLLPGPLPAFHAGFLLLQPLSTTVVELGWLLLLRLVLLCPLEALLLVVLLPALEALRRHLLPVSALGSLLLGLLTLLVRRLLLLPPLLVSLASHLLGLVGAHLLVLLGLSLLLGLSTLGFVVALLGWRLFVGLLEARLPVGRLLVMLGVALSVLSLLVRGLLLVVLPPLEARFMGLVSPPLLAVTLLPLTLLGALLSFVEPFLLVRGLMPLLFTLGLLEAPLLRSALMRLLAPLVRTSRLLSPLVVRWLSLSPLFSLLSVLSLLARLTLRVLLALLALVALLARLILTDLAGLVRIGLGVVSSVFVSSHGCLAHGRAG